MESIKIPIHNLTVRVGDTIAANWTADYYAGYDTRIIKIIKIINCFSLSREFPCNTCGTHVKVIGEDKTDYLETCLHQHKIYNLIQRNSINKVMELE